jgi:hypothetical protein
MNCRPTIRVGRFRLAITLVGLALSVVVTTTSLEAAQTTTATTGAVNGIVTDSTTAVVPGVTVSLSGPSLMTVQRAATDASGA